MMFVMCHVRETWPISKLLPDFKFIRTLQTPHHIVFDKRLSRYRISSQAFRPSSADNALSGDLEQLLNFDGLSAVALYPAVNLEIGAASLTVREIRSHDLTVHHEPVWVNWYHGAVRGIQSGKAGQKTKKALCALATEIIAIDQVEAARRESLLNSAAIVV